MTILYRHRRNDTNEVFYIGIGKKNRPNQKQNRNEFWKNIANKHGYTVDILMENLPWKIACELEIDLSKIMFKIPSKDLKNELKSRGYVILKEDIYFIMD